MAFAYFIGHFPKSFFPVINGGSNAITLCFVCLYLATAGGGPISVDATMAREANAQPLGLLPLPPALRGERVGVRGLSAKTAEGWTCGGSPSPV